MRFVEQERASDRFVVVGDFNALPGSPVYQHLVGTDARLDRRLRPALQARRSTSCELAHGGLHAHAHAPRPRLRRPGHRWLDFDDTHPFGDRTARSTGCRTTCRWWRGAGCRAGTRSRRGDRMPGSRAYPLCMRSPLRDRIRSAPDAPLHLGDGPRGARLRPRSLRHARRAPVALRPAPRAGRRLRPDRRRRTTSSTCTCPTRAPRPLPVVMYVHGGGFRMLSKETHRVMALAIARAGYLVFNINYRQGPRTRIPAPLEDACRALLWVQRQLRALRRRSRTASRSPARARAATWSRRSPSPARGAGPSRSRGTCSTRTCALRAVVATYGFLDLGHTDEYLKHPRMSRWTKALLLDAARSYLGHDCRGAARGPPAREPAAHHRGGLARAAAAAVLRVGGHAGPAACAARKRLKAALDRLGTQCELHVSPGEIHGYDAMVWRPSARAKWRGGARVPRPTHEAGRRGAATRDVRGCRVVGTAPGEASAMPERAEDTRTP